MLKIHIIILKLEEMMLKIFMCGISDTPFKIKLDFMKTRIKDLKENVLSGNVILFFIPVTSSTSWQVSKALNCIGRHSREEEFLFWQILEPSGIISLQIDLEGEASQSVLLEQVAKNLRFSKIIKVKILPGIEHL